MATKKTTKVTETKATEVKAPKTKEVKETKATKKNEEKKNVVLTVSIDEVGKMYEEFGIKNYNPTAKGNYRIMGNKDCSDYRGRMNFITKLNNIRESTNSRIFIINV